jgi:hypothetical protein
MLTSLETLGHVSSFVPSSILQMNICQYDSTSEISIKNEREEVDDNFCLYLHFSQW